MSNAVGSSWERNFNGSTVETGDFVVIAESGNAFVCRERGSYYFDNGTYRVRMSKRAALSALKGAQ